MEYIVKGRKPESVFRFFEEISAIPRGSYNEAGVADYLMAFAEKRGLEAYRDKAHNVLIKCPATKGLEDRPALLFQGHTDMVCEKNGDVEHDFLKDPLKLYVEGDLLGARGTTLGADNGIAVAMMLALLDGEISEHPAFECLFTTAEEVGLDGATSFDYSKIKARTMVNMDSEALGVVTCGCAGGIRSELSYTAAEEEFAGECLRVTVKGLKGGHSGENIKDGRANANKLMGRLLAGLLPKTDVRLISVEGGSKDNAIPRECQALIAVPDAEASMAVLEDLGMQIAKELSSDDRAFQLICEDAEPACTMFGKADTARIVAVMACAANGVFEMNHSVKGLVEFSRNLGVIRTEGNQVTLVFSARSGMESRLDASIAELDMLATVTGCTTRHHSRYPGWSFAEVSPLRNAYTKAYELVTGEKALVNVIHAGLECGVIFSKVPDMDMISVGPTMHDIHSPNEVLELTATETFWKTVEKLVEILSQN